MARRLKVHVLRRLKRPLLWHSRCFGWMLVDERNWLSRALWTGQPVESAELDRFGAVLDEMKPDLVVDIGANIGLYAMLACRHGVPRVLAFEPNPKVFNHLAANVFMNGWSERISLHNCALGQKPGKARLFLSRRHEEVSTLRPAAMDEKFTYESSVEVDVACFDALHAITDRRVVAKIDVEGFENQVLRGMRRFLVRNDVRLMVEILDPANGAHQFLDELGYREEERFNANYWFRRAGAGAS